MDNANGQNEEWKITGWHVIANDFFSLSRTWRFTKKRVPQIFAIWAAVAVLLRIPPFVSAFNAFGRNNRSPFFIVGSIGTNQQVDITPVFLIGPAAILVDLLFMALLYTCIRISRRMNKRRPVTIEKWAGRFANKMTDEVSSLMTHCCAATLVLMVDAWPTMHGTRSGFLCATMAASTFVFGAICYREG